MAINRNSFRVKCMDKCLITYNGTTRKGVLENLSVTGAHIQIDDSLMDFDAGSNCGLCFCSDQDKCPVENPCTVARTTTYGVGLKFIHYK
jgi:hypothetical protein